MNIPTTTLRFLSLIACVHLTCVCEAHTHTLFHYTNADDIVDNTTTNDIQMYTRNQGNAGSVTKRKIHVRRFASLVRVDDGRRSSGGRQSASSFDETMYVSEEDKYLYNTYICDMFVRSPVDIVLYREYIFMREY